MTSQIDPSKPTAVNAYTPDERANWAAAKAEIETLQYAALKQSTSVRRLAGLTFNTEDATAAATNSTLLQAASEAAQAAGKFIDFDYSDIGYLALNGGVSVLTDWYGDYGAKPELRLIGEQNGCVVGAANLAIERIRFNRLIWRTMFFSAFEKDSAGIALATFTQPHPYIVGTSLSTYYLGEQLTGWGVTMPVLSVPDPYSITFDTGTPGALVYDPTHEVAVTSSKRENGKLIYETSTPHYFYPGQRVSINGHIRPGVIQGVTSPQTLNLSTSQNDGSTRSYITGVNVTGITHGMSVWTATGEIPGGAVINSIVGTTIYLSALVTASRSGASVEFRSSTMDVSRLPVRRIYSTTKFAVDSLGRDDTSPDVNGATVYLSSTEDYWAGVRRQRDAGPSANMTLRNGQPNVTLRDTVHQGTGIYWYGRDFLFQRSLAEDTAWDSFHLTNGASGRLEQCAADFYQDDPFPVVNYDKSRTAGSSVHFMSCKATRGHGRGFLLSGSQKIIIEDGLVEDSIAGLFIVHDTSSFFTMPNNDIEVRSLVVRGCGLPYITPVGGGITLPVWIAGVNKLRVDSLRLIDSNHHGIGFNQPGAGNISFGRVEVDWTRSNQGLYTFQSGSYGAGPIEFDELILRETGATASNFDDLTSGRFRIKRLVTEDLNHSEQASQYGVSVGGGIRSEVVIDEWEWINQRYANVTPYNVGSGELAKLRIGSARFPWFIQTNIGIRMPSGAPGVTRPVAVLNAQNLAATGDLLMNMYPDMEGRPWYPLALHCYINSAGVTITDAGDIEVWTGAGRTGSRIFGAGRTWLSLHGANFPSRPLTGQISRLGQLTSGSNVVQHFFNGGRWGMVGPVRMDEVRIGDSAVAAGGTASGGIPANTYVTAVDRQAQTVTLSANATIDGLARMAYTGITADAPTLRTWSVGGAAPTQYLSINTALTGTNIGSCDIYLLGRLT